MQSRIISKMNRILKTMKWVVYLLLIILTCAGCTVRGGWPRFLRHGESPGWSGPKPNPYTWNDPEIERQWAEWERANGVDQPK
jgi:hypothetical protein